MIDTDLMLQRLLPVLPGIDLSLEQVSEDYCVLCAKVPGIQGCQVGFNPHAIENAQQKGIDVEGDIAQFILDDMLPLYRARRRFLQAATMTLN